MAFRGQAEARSSQGGHQLPIALLQHVGAQLVQEVGARHLALHSQHHAPFGLKGLKQVSLCWQEALTSGAGGQERGTGVRSCSEVSGVALELEAAAERGRQVVLQKPLLHVATATDDLGLS